LNSLEGIVDIYMPDAKFMDERFQSPSAMLLIIRRFLRKFSGRCKPPVGDLRVNSKGIAERGS